MKKILRAILTTIILAAASLLQPGEANAQTPKIRIEGAWEVILTGGGGSFNLRYTFAPGKTISEGTMIFSTELDAGPGVVCTPSLGAWKRISANQFLATNKAVCNESGFVFTIKAFDTFTVNDSSSAFTGTSTFIGFDENGDEIFTDEATLTGAILLASPPPLFAKIPDAAPVKKETPGRYRKR
jgi:hypothetical protein